MRFKDFATIGGAVTLAATPTLAHANNASTVATVQSQSIEENENSGTYLLGALAIVGVIAAGIAIFDRDDERSDRPVSP